MLTIKLLSYYLTEEKTKYVFLPDGTVKWREPILAPPPYADPALQSPTEITIVSSTGKSDAVYKTTSKDNQKGNLITNIVDHRVIYDSTTELQGQSNLCPTNTAVHGVHVLRLDFQLSYRSDFPTPQ